MTELYKSRKANGFCVRCGDKDERTEQGFVRCRKCEEAHKKARALRMQKRVSLGLCSRCGEETHDGYGLCPECRRVARERYRRKA